MRAHTALAAFLAAGVFAQAGPAGAQTSNRANLCDGRVTFASARFEKAWPDQRPVEHTLIVGIRNNWTRPVTVSATITHSLFTTVYQSMPTRLTPGSVTEATVGMAAPWPIRNQPLRPVIGGPNDYLPSVVVTCSW